MKQIIVFFGLTLFALTSCNDKQAECVKALPKVYDPQRKPWIVPEGADTQELKDQIGKCPSGALSYFMNGEENKEESTLETEIEVLENGPLLVYGTLKVTDKDGNAESKNKNTTSCRCVASRKKIIVTWHTSKQLLKDR